MEARPVLSASCRCWRRAGAVWGDGLATTLAVQRMSRLDDEAGRVVRREADLDEVLLQVGLGVVTAVIGDDEQLDANSEGVCACVHVVLVKSFRTQFLSACLSFCTDVSHRRRYSRSK